jgi:hypothetical protein
MREVEAGQCLEWRHISDRSPIYKSYWAQLKSLAVRDGVLVHCWELTDGKKETAQIIAPRSNVKEILAEIHGGTSGGHVGAIKTIDKIQLLYY